MCCRNQILLCSQLFLASLTPICAHFPEQKYEHCPDCQVPSFHKYVLTVPSWLCYPKRNGPKQGHSDPHKLLTSGTERETNNLVLYKTFAEQESAVVTISQMKKLVTKKTGLLPYATTFELLDLPHKGFKLILKLPFWLIVTKLQKHLTVPPNLLWQNCRPKSIINESLPTNKPTCLR